MHPTKSELVNVWLNDLLQQVNPEPAYIGNGEQLSERVMKYFNRKRVRFNEYEGFLIPGLDEGANEREWKLTDRSPVHYKHGIVIEPEFLSIYFGMDPEKYCDIRHGGDALCLHDGMAYDFPQKNVLYVGKIGKRNGDDMIENELMYVPVSVAERMSKSKN